MDSDSELDIIEQAERLLSEEEVENVVGDDNKVNVDEGETVEVQADPEYEDEHKIIKPKRAVRNPLPKLNADTLRGAKGLPALPELFAKQQFKGINHEEIDLNVLLKSYEYWCHRLFPKYQFDQCIDKIEALGHKKVVMTFVKQIRMGILDNEPQINELSIDEDETNASPAYEQQQVHIALVEKRFEQTVQERQQMNMNQTFDSILTEEQKQMAEENKQRALNIRREKLKLIQEQAQEKLLVQIPIANYSSNLEQTAETDEFLME